MLLQELKSLATQAERANERVTRFQRFTPGYGARGEPATRSLSCHETPGALPAPGLGLGSALFIRAAVCARFAVRLRFSSRLCRDWLPQNAPRGIA